MINDIYQFHREGVFEKSGKQKFMVIETGPKTITQKTMHDKGKTAGDFTDLIGTKIYRLQEKHFGNLSLFRFLDKKPGH